MGNKGAQWEEEERGNWTWGIHGERRRYMVNMGGTWWTWEVHGGHGRYMLDWEVHGGGGRYTVDVGGTCWAGRCMVDVGGTPWTWEVHGRRGRYMVNKDTFMNPSLWIVWTPKRELLDYRLQLMCNPDSCSSNQSPR